MSSDLVLIANSLRNWVFNSAATPPGGRIATTPEEIQRMLLAEIEGGSGSIRPVSEADALRIAAVWACVRLLSSVIAMLPVSLFKKSGATGAEKNKVADDHIAHKLLHVRPNAQQTPFEFKQMLVAHVLMRGNFYAQKVGFGDEISDLLPLDPSHMTPKRKGGAIVYHYRPGDAGREMVFEAKEIFHVRGLSLDGLRGLAVLHAARNAVSVARTLEEAGANLMENGSTPSGVLETDLELSEEAFQRIRADFEANYMGASNKGRPMILETGLKWKQMSMSAEDSAFIDQRKFTRSDIAMFFGVPPHMIGDIERGTSWGSGLEQQNLGFLIYTLAPYLINIEQAALRDLVPADKRSKFVVKFDTSVLTRADFGARQTGLQIQKRNGVISANDWRKIEGLDPIEDAEADRYVSDVAAAPSPGPSEGTGAGDGSEAD